MVALRQLLSRKYVKSFTNNGHMMRAVTMSRLDWRHSMFCHSESTSCCFEENRKCMRGAENDTRREDLHRFGSSKTFW